MDASPPHPESTNEHVKNLVKLKSANPAAKGSFIEGLRELQHAWAQHPLTAIFSALVILQRPTRGFLKNASSGLCTK